METFLSIIASQSPWMAGVGLIVGVFIPKILDYVLKTREGRINERERSLKRLEETANDLYRKLERLDAELDAWKGKYYQLKKDFLQLESMQERAIQRLKDAELQMDWPKGSLESTENKHEALGSLLNNCPVGVHLVGGDGRILWANKAELELLGYDGPTYFGHPITYFHADADVINSILDTLISLEDLSSCPARLKAKDGSFVHVLINSNVYVENGAFVHTRCFTSPITEQTYNQLVAQLPPRRF